MPLRADDPQDPAALRASLRDDFARVRAATESLAAWLTPEDQQLQSQPDCSPTKWHRGHTTWFFEEFVLGPAGVAPRDARHRYLFNSYYDAVGPRHPRPRRGVLSRPSAEEVGAWRRAVDLAVDALLARATDPAIAALRPVLELGVAHEEQHQELLLTDVLHAFSESPLLPAVRPAAHRPPIDAPRGAPLRWVEREGGVVSIGHAGAGFAFDNEGPRHRVFLEPYALASRPISVGEVLGFVAARGYETPSLWLSEGFAWARSGAREAPAMMRVEGGRAVVFGVDGEREAAEDEPASHLSYYEADALARFLGGRLPTEAEWEHAAAALDPRAANDRERGALRPLPDDGPEGLRQMFGDVWEWTGSAYAPYPGFVAAPGAVGEYNGKFMVNQVVLRGGSCFTPRGHVRASYRNFWHPQVTFQVTGARVARSLGGARA